MINPYLIDAIDAIVSKHPLSELRITYRSLRNFVRHARQRRDNIIMLHAGRCGSSVLSDLLNQHPEIAWRNEPFEGLAATYRAMHPNHRAERYIRDILYRMNTPVFGFDFKYLQEQHLNSDYAALDLPGFLDTCSKVGINRHILLSRKNHLRRAVSTAIGAKTKTWNSDRNPEKTTTVELSLNNFVSYGKSMSLLDFFASIEQAESVITQTVFGEALLTLSYEDDIEKDPRIGYEKCCEFLGLEPAPVNVRLKRMNPRPLHLLLENYNEVADYLKNTPYAWMLEG